ncbi:hypothetical protein EV1_006158 [Malus domestica]
MATSAAHLSLSFFNSSIFLPSSSHKPLSALAPNNSLKISKPLSVSAELATLPVLSFTGDKRRGTASTLTHAEVSGGGRKPYPLRPGGGVVFGPKPRDWSIKINRKEKRLAISTAVASAAENTIVVEDFSDEFERLEKTKTAEFIAAMKRWGLDPKEKTTFLVTEVANNVRLSSRNIGTLKTLTRRTLNLFDILNADKLIMTPEIVDYLNARYGVDYDGETEEEEEEEEEVAEEEEGGVEIEGTAADESSDAAE